MEQRVKILAFPHKAHVNSKGVCPMRYRITTNHDQVVITPGIWIKPDTWNEKNKSLRGRSSEVEDGNVALKNVEGKILQIIKDLERNDKTVTGKLIKAVYEGGVEVRPTIVSYLDRVISEIESHELKPKGDMSLNRFKKYKTFREKMIDFLNTDKGKQYHFMNELDMLFYKNFSNWLTDHGGVKPGRVFKEKGIKIEMPLSKESSRSYKSLLKTICYRAVPDNVMPSNPYAKLKIAKDNNSRPYLPVRMVDAIENLNLDGKPGVAFVRDMFIILCYTGLPWEDLQSVTWHKFVDVEGQPAEVENIYSDDADVFFYRGRNKNNELMLTPVFPKVKNLFRKYRNHPGRKGDHLVPTVSAKTFNEHLKVIAELAGVHFKHMNTDKERQASLTSYVGRHTFATMMMTKGKVGKDLRLLANMMGHTTTTQAEGYARLLPDLINEQSKNAYQNLMRSFNN